MATFNKFDIFATDLALAHHQLHTDTLKVALTNIAPTAGMTIKANLTFLDDINGYTATDILNEVVQATNTANITIGLGSDKVTWTATGTIAEFQYVVIYNDSCADPVKPLVGWADYNAKVNLTTGESFTVAFAPNLLTIT